MSNTRIEIIIDELALRGFSPAQREAIGTSLSQELQRLVVAGNPAALSHLGSAPLLRADNIDLNPGAQGHSIGEQVAKSVYGGLTK